MTNEIYSLKYLLESHADSLNQHGDIYVGKKLESSKGQSKKSKALQSFAQAASDDALMVIDITLFGGATDGFYVTSEYIYVKEFLEDRRKFRILDIDSIYVDKKNSKLVINGIPISIVNMIDKMEIFVECIRSYIDVVNMHSMGDSAVSLVAQLKRVLHETDKWGISMMQKIDRIESALNESDKISSSLEKMATQEINKLQLEVKERLDKINSSFAIREAAIELGSKIHIRHEFSDILNMTDQGDNGGLWETRVLILIFYLRLSPDIIKKQLEQVIMQLESV